MRPPVDGTGPKLRGTGGWLFGRHGGRTRRSWKELRLATDADAGRIVAAALIDHDGSRVGPLLDQVDGPVASSAADGAFDRDDVHAGVASRHAAAAAAAPPRPGAAAGDPAGTAPTRRDRRIEALAERGRKGRQKASGHDRRALVEVDSPAGSG
jgi:hypothetical protein